VAAIRPRVRSDLAVVELEGEAVIYDPESDELHQLNSTATIVFNCFDGTGTMKQIAEGISSSVGVPIEEVEKGVRALYRDFRERGLIEARERKRSQSIGVSKHNQGA